MVLNVVDDVDHEICFIDCDFIFAYYSIFLPFGDKKKDKLNKMTLSDYDMDKWT